MKNMVLLLDMCIELLVQIPLSKIDNGWQHYWGNIFIHCLQSDTDSELQNLDWRKGRVGTKNWFHYCCFSSTLLGRIKMAGQGGFLCICLHNYK